MGRIFQCVAVLVAALIGATACSAVLPRTPVPEATRGVATLSEQEAAGSAAAAAPAPTVKPAVTATPIPRAVQSGAVPSPVPTDQRTYELCVSIASDSNGYGHVTLQRPDTGEVAITYIKPLAIPLQAHLDALGLNYLRVVDRSLSAGGLTIASSNYLDSDPFFHLKNDHCKFVVITPFYPDVAVNLSRPEDYVANLRWLLDAVTSTSPDSRVLLLNFYRTDRAEFTADNSGRGLSAQRITEFNDALAAACGSGGTVAAYAQVVCIDISAWFDDMGTTYLLKEMSQQQYRAALYQATGYTPILESYFETFPDGILTGDGIHLSLAGRDRLSANLAQVIHTLNDDF